MDSVGLLVRNLDAEFLQSRQSRSCTHTSRKTHLLNRHNDLYGVEAVKTKVVVEVRLDVKLQSISQLESR